MNINSHLTDFRAVDHAASTSQANNSVSSEISLLNNSLSNPISSSTHPITEIPHKLLFDKQGHPVTLLTGSFVENSRRFPDMLQLKELAKAIWQSCAFSQADFLALCHYLIDRQIPITEIMPPDIRQWMCHHHQHRFKTAELTKIVIGLHIEACNRRSRYNNYKIDNFLQGFSNLKYNNEKWFSASITNDAARGKIIAIPHDYQEECPIDGNDLLFNTDVNQPDVYQTLQIITKQPSSHDLTVIPKGIPGSMLPFFTSVIVKYYAEHAPGNSLRVDFEKCSTNKMGGDEKHFFQEILMYTRVEMGNSLTKNPMYSFEERRAIAISLLTHLEALQTKISSLSLSQTLLCFQGSTLDSCRYQRENGKISLALNCLVDTLIDTKVNSDQTSPEGIALIHQQNSDRLVYFMKSIFSESDDLADLPELQKIINHKKEDGELKISLSDCLHILQPEPRTKRQRFE